VTRYSTRFFGILVLFLMPSLIVSNPAAAAPERAMPHSRVTVGPVTRNLDPASKADQSAVVSDNLSSAIQPGPTRSGAKKLLQPGAPPGEPQHKTDYIQIGAKLWMSPQTSRADAEAVNSWLPAPPADVTLARAIAVIRPGSLSAPTILVATDFHQVQGNSQRDVFYVLTRLKGTNALVRSLEADGIASVTDHSVAITTSVKDLQSGVLVFGPKTTAGSNGLCVGCALGIAVATAVWQYGCTAAWFAGPEGAVGCAVATGVIAFASVIVCALACTPPPDPNCSAGGTAPTAGSTPGSARATGYVNCARAADAISMWISTCTSTQGCTNGPETTCTSASHCDDVSTIDACYGNTWDFYLYFQVQDQGTTFYPDGKAYLGRYTCPAAPGAPVCRPAGDMSGSDSSNVDEQTTVLCGNDPHPELISEIGIHSYFDHNGMQYNDNGMFSCYSSVFCSGNEGYSSPACGGGTNVYTGRFSYYVVYGGTKYTFPPYAIPDKFVC
jgi:hypothetical protein